MGGPPPPLDIDKKLDISGFQGSYLQAMTSESGIKACLDADELTPFSVSGWDSVQQAAANFDPKVYQGVTTLFAAGETGLRQLVTALQGSGVKLTPGTLTSAIAAKMQGMNLVAQPNAIGLAADKCSPFLALASGAGTLVRIDGGDYCYHVGYKPGSANSQQLAVDVKSGRSFGASPGHNALDASDIFYLGELGSFLDPKETADSDDFFLTIFNALAKCDTSMWTTLPPLGQALATDFVAIYTAELDRNLMSNLQTHSWEDDLAEVSMLSAYGVPAGLILQNGKLVPGSPADYFGKGPSGSGIGETRIDRHMLQAAVCQAEKTIHSEDYQALAGLIGGAPPNGDLLHQTMVFLNDPARQETLSASADQVSNAVVEFLHDIRVDADQITARVKTALNA